MLWADVYVQRLDPLGRPGVPWLPEHVPWSPVWSTLLAAVPVLVLFYLLVPRRWSPPRAGAVAAAVGLVLAVLVCGMHPLAAGMSFLYGVGYGLLPIGWTIFNAMLLYNVTVQTGQFDIVRRSVANLSGDARIQAVLIGFAFGAFLEGAAGAGTPVAICGAIMVGLGFDPFLAAVLCLIANTSPVAYGGLGTPLLTLNGVTNLDAPTLSIMAGHQLPLLSLFIPMYMVMLLVWRASAPPPSPIRLGWAGSLRRFAAQFGTSLRKTLEIWPALAVAGGSFAAFQYVFATMTINGISLFYMTDIGGGIFSLVLTAIFLRFWKPRAEWRFDKKAAETKAPADMKPPAGDPHAAAAAALVESAPPSGSPAEAETPLTRGAVALAWTPFLIMSVMLLLSGAVRVLEKGGDGLVGVGPIRTNYLIPVAWLHRQTERDPFLHPEKRTQASALLVADQNPWTAAADAVAAPQALSEPEKAEFNFSWVTAPGSPVLAAALLSMLLFRMKPKAILWVFQRTCLQMKVPIPTIAFMLGLSYVTRYAGMDATLGVAFANTGALYPYFAALLGWLGVFLTGTDAGSNALFGSLQKITATQVHNTGVLPLDLGQAQVLICTANSTGGVMGKMIDAQSIVVATAATNQLGREADIFKAVIWHSILLASVVGLITLLQAYVWPFTLLVPHLP